MSSEIWEFFYVAMHMKSNLELVYPYGRLIDLVMTEI